MMFFMCPVAPVFYQDLEGSSSAAPFAQSYWNLYYPPDFSKKSPKEQSCVSPFCWSHFSCIQLIIAGNKKKNKSQEWYSSMWLENPQSKALFPLLPAETDV